MEEGKTLVAFGCSALEYAGAKCILLGKVIKVNFKYFHLKKDNGDVHSIKRRDLV
jgi:hypothetical protein